MGKFCGYCGSPAQDTDRVCGNCGKPFGDTPAYTPAPPAEPVAPVVPAQVDAVYNPEFSQESALPVEKESFFKKNKKLIIIGASALVVVVAVVILLIVIFGGAGNSPESTAEAYASAMVNSDADMAAGISIEALDKDNIEDVKEDFLYDAENFQDWFDSKIRYEVIFCKECPKDLVNTMKEIYSKSGELMSGDLNIKKLDGIAEAVVEFTDGDNTEHVTLGMVKYDGKWMVADVSYYADSTDPKELEELFDEEMEELKESLEFAMSFYN